MNTRGRTWAALILLGFVVIAGSVIQRRMFGMAQAEDIMQLELTLQEKMSAKRKLESEIEAGRSLARIGKIAEEHLGMRGPEETPVVHIFRKPKQ